MKSTAKPTVDCRNVKAQIVDKSETAQIDGTIEKASIAEKSEMVPVATSTVGQTARMIVRPVSGLADVAGLPHAPARPACQWRALSARLPQSATWVWRSP